MASYEGKRFRGDGERPLSTGGAAGGSRFARDARSAGGAGSAEGVRPAGGSRFADGAKPAGDPRSAGGARFAGNARSAGAAHPADGTRLSGNARPAGGARPTGNARPGSHFSGASSRGDGVASAGVSARHAAQPGSAPRAAGPSGASHPAVQPPARIQTSRSQRANRVHASYQPEGAAQSYASSAAPRGRAASRGAASAHARGGSSGGRRGPGGGHGSGRDDRERTGAGRGKRNIVSYVLIGIGVVLLLVAAGIFIWAQLGYRQAAETYSSLTQYVTVDSEGDGIPVVDWDALKAQNEDIVAWIYVPGTDISYPVVQGETNDEYLRTLPDGTWNNNGSIMLDCDQTAPGMVDQQTTVYGHHMNDGSMFQPIEQTLDQANFDAMDTVYYLTPDATYKLTPLFTARVEESYVEARQANFGDTAALQQYLTDLRSYAQAEASDVDERLSQTEQVLSLVTCSGMAPADHRAVMVCTIAEETPAAGASSAAE